ncbi:hypothetical protein [Actinoplanes sp. TFC3]|uniref:hypothetical protein n=1 Tax=Actinoplanes sp. TFC3 TaxID=1710355 RepID=UPI00082F57E2|nr:hypothetical protein [Actinoplanes sp. TFC3]
MADLLTPDAQSDGNRSTPDPAFARPWDLSNDPNELRDAEKGLSAPPETGPPADDIRAVALFLLRLFGACMLLIILATSALAWLEPTGLKDLIAFFGTVIATLGTLLGSVVAFYFTRR